MLVDRAQLLTLTAPEMTVLVGGLRVLGANFGGSELGVFTDRPETLTNDFFVNLLKTSTSMKWEAASEPRRVRGARSCDRREEVGRHAGRPDLRFELAAPRAGGSLRDRRCGGAFVDAFVAAWSKVMNLDRFDLA